MKNSKERGKTKILKRETGITLIALIVTIVVLIILATITINLVFSDKGIIAKAKEAAEKTKQAVINDQEQVNEVAGHLENMLNEMGGSSIQLVKPKVNLNGYTSGTWTNKDITINLSGNVEGIKYQYSDNNGTSWNNCESTITINQDQDKTYIFRATYENENYSEVTETYQVKRDTVAPIFNIDTVPAVDNISVNVKDIVDNGSGVSETTVISYYYKLKSENDSSYKLAYNGPQSKYVISKLAASETYSIKVVLNDNAGNVGNVIKEVTTTACFTAGTQVLTETGMKNIEDIQLGEKVYTINLDNNKRELKKVTNKFSGYTTEIYEITIGSELVKATPRHQFYIVDKGWIRAYDLKVGDRLVVKDNNKLIINKIVNKTDVGPIPVYNMEIEENNNYLVTKYELLVHNADSITDAV